MRKNILKLDFSKLRKHEVKTLASRVIKAVEGYNPETLQIKEIYDLLVELEPQIGSLELSYIAHPISKKLNAMRKQRLAFAKGIINQMEVIEMGKISGKEASLEVAKPIVLQHLQSLWKYDDTKIYDNIILFSKHVAENAQLQTAMETLDLLTYHDSLQSVNNAIEEQFNARTKSISERPKRATPGIVAAIKTALQDLFKQIEVAQVKNLAHNYTPLIDELNKQIAIVKATLKARSSISKKKAEENALENNEVVVEGGSEGVLETIHSTQRMYPMNVEVEDETNLEQLDKKKTVAMSAKLTRLPVDSTKA